MSSAVARLNQQELDNKVPDEASWHNDYKDTAWVKMRGLNSDLTEGDILCVFSQFGEIDDLNLVRDASTGRILVCLIKFEQFKSAWLTVDNFNDVELVGQRISVDHHREAVRKPKRGDPELSMEDRLQSVQSGRRYQEEEEEEEAAFSLNKGVDVFGAAAEASKAKRLKSWKLTDQKKKKKRSKE